MEDLTEVLAAAIEMEREGRQAYLNAARRMKDPVIAAVLQALAEDENHHERMIRQYYEALERSQGWPHLEPDTNASQPARQRIEQIVQETGERIGPDASFLEVYEVAREMELQTRDYYRSQADATDDPQLVKFFRFLAGMEQTHLEMLSMLVESTREAAERGGEASSSK